MRKLIQVESTEILEMIVKEAESNFKVKLNKRDEMQPNGLNNRVLKLSHSQLIKLLLIYLVCVFPHL